MQIDIKGTGLSISKETDAYFDRHAKKIGKLVPSEPAKLWAELEHLTEHKTEAVFRAELTLSAPDLSLRSEAKSPTLFAAIDEATDRMVGELRKRKGKRMRLFKLGGEKLKRILRFSRDS